MSSAPSRLRPNRPDVIDQTFNGEAVLVNFRTGRYYSLDAQATSVWELIVAEQSPAAAAQALADRFGATRDEVEASLPPLLRRLLDEELVVGELDAPVNAETVPGGVFAPSLQVFKDMEDLLLLDPIHEIDVDGSGWPRLPVGS
jgi:hypothetical protein